MPSQTDNREKVLIVLAQQLMSRDREVHDLREEMLRRIQSYERLLKAYLGLLQGEPGVDRNN